MADIQPSSSFSPALPTGITLGNYTIRKVIGSGGFGITYLAQEEGTDKLFVIKENYPVEVSFRDMTSLTVGPSGESRKESYDWALTRFLNEAKILSRLSHPNIVPIQKAFKALGTAYYVMPHVEGKELSQAAPAPDIISAEWLQPILEKILSALVYLHGQGLIHRDIKPNNILMRSDGEPVLIDFGTARALESTHSHTHIGTPGYMPLEQLAGKGKRGPWTDIYALGATCYRLITGKVPPHAMDRMEEDEYFPLVGRPSLEGRFPKHFLRSIDKALHMDRRKRWQSAQEWLKVLKIKPATPSGDATPANEAKPASPKKKKALIISFILLFVTLCCGGLFYPHIRLMTMGITPEQYSATLCIAAHSGDVEKVRLLLAAGTNVNKADEYGRTPLGEAIEEGQIECLNLLLAEPEIDVNKEDNFGFTPLQITAMKGLTECMRALLSTPGIDVNKDTPLYTATVNDQPECVKLLLSTPGINVNQALSHGDTPLSNAANEGRVACLQALLAAPGIDTSDYPPLCLAVMSNDLQKIRELLANGADPNQNGPHNNYFPLYYAASCGYVDCTRALLSAPGIDVNKANPDGDTPLIVAAKMGHTECVQAILAAPGIDVNKENWRGLTPLHCAALSGHTECVRALLSTPGIDVNKADRVNLTPLHCAAEYNNAECVRALLSAPGIDVNMSNPLCAAANNEHPECVKLLLAAPGIDVNQVSSFGNTPLTIAAGNGRAASLIALLAAPDIDTSGYPPLCLAVMSNDSQKIRELLANGADPNQNDNHENCSPLYYAAICGYADCIRALLSAPEIDVNHANQNGWTPLNWATYKGHTDCIRALLSAPGIDVNKANCNGWAPLHWAADHGHTKSVRLLIAAPRIDINQKGANDRTPLYWATINHHRQCAELIREAGGR